MAHHPSTSQQPCHQQANPVDILQDSLLALTLGPGLGPLDSFQRFPDLPPEIRIAIWRHALINECSDRLVLLDKRAFHVIKPSHHLVSPFLSASRESRSEATAFYELRLEVRLLSSVLRNCLDYRRTEIAAGVEPTPTARVAWDEAFKRMGETEEDSVGTLYVSVIRDTFLLSPEYFIGMLRTWTSAPLPEEEALRKIRRIASVHEEVPFAACSYATCTSYGLSHVYEFTRAVDQVRLGNALLRDARSGWLGAHFPSLRHYGVFWIDQSIPEKGEERSFLSDLERDGRRSAFAFRRFLRRVEVEDMGRLDWELEVDEAWVDIRPLPEETFELGMEDLDDIVGGL